MPPLFCAACRTLLAAGGAVVVFGNAPVHAACWSELRKPPGKAAMDFSAGQARRATSPPLPGTPKALAGSAAAAGPLGSPAAV
jgi:hypothetical protein